MLSATTDSSEVQLGSSASASASAAAATLAARKRARSDSSPRSRSVRLVHGSSSGVTGLTGFCDLAASVPVGAVRCAEAR
jgi:hypothetical protein